MTKQIEDLLKTKRVKINLLYKCKCSTEYNMLVEFKKYELSNEEFDLLKGWAYGN